MVFKILKSASRTINYNSILSCIHKLENVFQKEFQKYTKYQIINSRNSLNNQYFPKIMNDDEEEYQALFQQHQRIINDQNIQLQFQDEEINKLCIQIEQCQNRLVETQSLVLNLATQVNVVQKQKRKFFTFARRKLENNKKFISIV